MKKKYVIGGVILVVVFISIIYAFLNNDATSLKGSSLNISKLAYFFKENDYSCKNWYETSQTCLEEIKGNGKCKLYNNQTWIHDKDRDGKVGCFDSDCRKFADVECNSAVYNPQSENNRSCNDAFISEEECIQMSDNPKSCVKTNFAPEGWKQDKDLDSKAGCDDLDCTSQFVNLRKSCELWKPRRELSAQPSSTPPISIQSCDRDSNCGDGMICEANRCAQTPASPPRNTCTEYERSSNDARTIRRNDFQDGIQYQHRGRLYGYNNDGNRQEVIESCIDTNGDGVYETVNEYFCGIGWDAVSTPGNCTVICSNLEGTQKTRCERNARCVNGECQS